MTRTRQKDTERRAAEKLRQKSVVDNAKTRAADHAAQVKFYSKPNGEPKR